MLLHGRNWIDHRGEARACSCHRSYVCERWNQPGAGLLLETHQPMKSSTLHIFSFFLTAFLSISSGIIAQSDGLTMFNVTQAIVERGEISVSGEALPIGVGGKRYSPYGIAQSLLAIPLYLPGKLASFLIPERFRNLTLKGSVSLTNAIVGAVVCLLLFRTGQQFGYSKRVSLQLAMSFAFSTFFVVYATKSFLTHPLETLCLTGTVYSLVTYSRDRDTRALICAGLFSGGGILTKWTFTVNLPVFILYLLATSSKERRVPNFASFFAPVAVSLALALGYNYARFGSILATGYTPATTRATSLFSTPLSLGVYGLLFSPGRSLFLYAPIAALGFISMRAFSKSHKREMWMLIGLFMANLSLIAKHLYWGGGGSWGPRYLTLVLPCLVLPIGALLETKSIAVRRGFVALSLVGLLVQFGGVSIFYGTYYRAIGHYKTHYLPTYAPAWGQLKMAGQNWAKFLAGEKPTLTIGPGSERIPLSEADREKLRQMLDLWFAYAYYAGAPFGLCLLGMAGVIGAAATMGWRVHRSCGIQEE